MHSLSRRLLPSLALTFLALAALAAGGWFAPLAVEAAGPGTTSSVTITRADGSLTATWPAVAGAATYHVTYTDDGGASWELAALDHPASADADGNESITFAVDNAKTYVVGVRAKNADGGGGWRNSASSGPFTPLAPTPTPTPAPTPPSTPSSVTVTRSDGSLTATWPAVANAATYHVTYTADSGRNWSLAALDHPADADADGNESITFAVMNGATYVVGVRAKNASGGGGWRNSPPALPTAATGIIVQDTSGNAITALSIPEGGEASYQVKLAAQPASYVEVCIGLSVRDRNDSSITFKGEDSGVVAIKVPFTPENWDTAQTVTLVAAEDDDAVNGVRDVINDTRDFVEYFSGSVGLAVTEIDNDPPTPTPTPTPAPTTPPARPSGLTATAGDGSVTLAWNDPANAAVTGYEYRTRAAPPAPGWSAWTAIAGSDSTTASFTVEGLTNGTEYRFKLRAVNAAGAGAAAPADAPWYVAATPGSSTLTTDGASGASGQVGIQSTVTLTASDVTYSTARLAISGHTGIWYYKQTAPGAGGCSGGIDATATPTLKRLEPGVSYTWKAYSDSACITEVTSDASDAEFTTSTVMLSTIWHIVPEGESVPHTVWLSKQPSANVTVAVATSGDSDITASPASLTFTSSNWSTPQTVTLSAAQDTDTVPGAGKGDGAYAYGATDVTHTATSSDSDFNNVSVVLKATEGDDDVCSGTTAVGGSGVTSGAIVEDCDTLLAAKDIVNGSTGVVNNWSTGLALNSWSGITAANDRVTRFNLAFFIHVVGDGNLPNTIADLDALTVLVMESSGTAALPGPVPPGIENLTGLTRLGLYKRELTGQLPANIGNLTALTRLELDYNQLSGPLPASMGNLTNLARLYLDSNNFSGAIPTQLGGLTGMTTDNFALGGSQLIGCIPTGWSKYASKINPQKDANGNDVTLPLCPGPVAQPTADARNTSAIVTWSAPAVGEATRYQIRWRPCLVSQPFNETCHTYNSPPPPSGPDTRTPVPAWAPWTQVTYLDGHASGLDTVLGGDTTTYTIRGLHNGVRYQVKVRPGFTLPGRFGKTIYGPWSTPSEDVWPNPPWLSAGSVAATTATLKIANHDGAWSYKELTPNPGNCVNVSSGTTAGLSSLTSGTTYTYQGYSAAGCNSGDWIASDPFTTQ